MLAMPRWKVISILIACFMGVICALPSLLSEEQRKALPAWLPHQSMHLGLDLQGGSHLLLEVNMEAYITEQLHLLQQTVRNTLRKEKLGYVDLKADTNAVSFTARDPQKISDILKLLRRANPDVEINQAGTNQITLQFTESYRTSLQQKVMEQSIEIVRRRVDETGTKEPSIQRQGENRILLQVPGLQDPAHLKQLLGKTAKLSFHIVDETANIAGALQGQVPPGMLLLPSDKAESEAGMHYYVVHKEAMITGDLLTDARATLQEASPVVSFAFNTLGAKLFGDATKTYVGRPFAIVLDNKVISAPVIREPILGGAGVISGNFTMESANDLALLLRAGALPAPLMVVEERTVGPSLGADSITAGKLASLVGVAFVVVFMLVNYGLFGMFANVALVINVVFVIAAMSLLQATLTMPGIAGMVLTMGMAVDANVLIFERMREELRNGASVSGAIERGFKQAFATITDSNITTLIAGLILYEVGSGPVKGFAVTLAIGILASMFTAVTLTRLMIYYWHHYAKPKTLAI